METKIFKMTNGDDVLSEYEEKGDKIIFKNPIKLMPIPTEDGDMGFGMLPWCLFSDVKEFEIDSSHIIASLPCPQDFYNKYNEEYGPGIITPSDQGIII